MQKILIIDDDIAGTQLLITLLELDGYQGCKPESWVDLVGVIEKQRPDLVIMDVRLRTLDGFELLGQLRAHPDPDVASTPVLMMSAEDHRARCKTSGANGFLEKPFDRETLLGIVQKITEGGVSNH